MGLRKSTVFTTCGNIISACIWIFWPSPSAIAVDVQSTVEHINSQPIEPAVLRYLSDHLESRECAQLCTFLALQNINSLAGAPKNLKNSWGGGGRRGNGPINFACHHTLKLWNDNVATTEVEGRLDGREYVENLVIFGLKQANRKDLADWLKNLRDKRRHSEILRMENEWADRESQSATDLSKSFERDNEQKQSVIGSLISADGNSMNITGNQNPKPETSSLENEDGDEEEVDIEKDIQGQMYVVIMFAAAGVFGIAIIAITVWCCSRREPIPLRYKAKVSATRLEKHQKSGSEYGLHVDV